MEATDLKYYLGIGFILFFDALHIIFFSSNEKYDVYMYYEHSRYLTNILSDVSNLFRFSILTYWLIQLRRNIFIPFFVMSILAWFSYFLFYNQISSLALIPSYLIIALIYNRKILRI